MSNGRIYSEKVNINSKNVCSFYNNRAQKIDSMKCPYTAVLLNDEEPKHAEEWDKFEKEYILPQLKIDKSSNVLDIGCGIGRWAESIIPLANYYVGTDYAPKMVEAAQDRNKQYSNCKFYNYSFQDLVKNKKDFKEKFSKLIIGGVCMYINDTDLKVCFNGLNDFLDDLCTIYFTETVAVETRLTLNEFYSDALKSKYDVIYRTSAEYNEYYKVLLDKGFRIVKQDYLPKINSDEKYKETERWYTILER
jgi:ubiquinone/menaquinone biosynthesis C-methylase UbiE